MFPSQDRTRIANIYTLLQESPDNITVNGKFYGYDDPGLDVYTGFFINDGEYYVYGSNKHIMGHEELLKVLRKGQFTIVKSSYPNMEELRNARNMSLTEFRIWKNFDILSTYDNFDPSYNEVMVEVIKSIGDNPEAYLFDLRNHRYEDNQAMTYGELTGSDISEKERLSNAQRRANNAAAREELKKIMAKPKEVDYGMGRGEQPSFYNKNPQL